MSFTIRIPEQRVNLPKKVKEGDVIDWSDEKVKERVEQEIVISLTTELSIEPRDIFKYIRVSLGDQLKQGQLLAEKKTFFTRHALIAPSSGEVRAINHTAGTLTYVIEELTDVPFIFKGKYVKTHEKELYFSVDSGVEVELNYGLDKTFGAHVSYVRTPEEITLEKVENTVVITSLSTTMNMSKIMALGPIAIISYHATYYPGDNLQLVVKNKADWSELLKKELPMCLYLEGSKKLYLYSFAGAK